VGRRNAQGTIEKDTRGCSCYNKEETKKSIKNRNKEKRKKGKHENKRQQDR
jgi:hypothetical protein